MRYLKKGEYGKKLLFNAGVDISGADSHTVEFTKPDCTMVTKTATLGTSDVTGEDINGNTVTFSANQYSYYTLADGDIDQAGCWKYRALNPSASLSVPGDYGTFTVVE